MTIELTRAQANAASRMCYKQGEFWYPVGGGGLGYGVSSATTPTITSLVVLGLGSVHELSRNEFGKNKPEYIYPGHAEGKNGTVTFYIPKSGYPDVVVRSYPSNVCCPNCGHIFDAKSAKVKKGKGKS